MIGNPPYIPLEEMKNSEKQIFKEQFYQLDRKYDSSVLFIIRGFNISTNKAHHSFIAPITWQTGENYSKFRKYLFNNNGLLKIINLPFNIFEEAYVDTAIYFLRSQETEAYFIYNYNKKEKIETLDNIEFAQIEFNLIDENKNKLILNSFISRILRRLQKFKVIPLGELTISTQGLSGSNFTKTNQKAKTVFPFLSKGNVYNYNLTIEGTYNTDLSQKKNLIKFYDERDKLLIRRIINRQDRLSVAVTNKKMVFKKDINPFVVIDASFDPLYLLGIMASKFISFLYINNSTIATKDDFRQTTLAELRNIPIIKIERNEQKSISKLVGKILAAKEKDSNADTTALEIQIDILVYKLYGLTYDEVKIVDPDFELTDKEYEKYFVT